MNSSVVLTGEQATRTLGSALAGHMRPGHLVLLSGPYGAGKTTFVRGWADGLGVDPAAVSSPSFALVNEYRGRLPVLHLDAWRLAPGAAVEELGVLEALDAGAVAIIEWGERVALPPGLSIWSVELGHRGDGTEGRLARIIDPLGRGWEGGDP